MFSELKIREFFDKVASSDPTPGGGSVAAMNVAAGCSCALLMANVTLGKEKFAAVQNDVHKIVVELEDIKKEALVLMDRDKDAYDAVVNAFKMKKETDAEKDARKKAIFSATVKSTEVPIKIAETALSAVGIMLKLVEIANKKAVSDSITGLFNCYAGAVSSIAVARLNLSGTWDNPEIKANFISKVKSLEIEAENALEDIRKSMTANLSS
ncbi:MAG TPA: cyclodeaminase/cyclohydrolase family protein [Candidatus Wallbacteria bacterium]|nr:MAG: Methenyltetrahydrofolate cyclohydrolase [bacterium ADurb.Bin243]HOD39287.1 cyclodeaminase/cyclohydrolase family protein [Candidatus Wallbacteria bacterium]HOT76110.1 cyclodeaminase/cyclohydrolase family protein [Candidatus Wallbacteria bacterium]